MNRNGKSIFRTTLLAMLLVLGVEFILLSITLYLSNVSQQLNTNATDILKKQVENRSSYLENIMIKNQDLDALSQKIQTVFLELEKSGKISLDTLSTNSDSAFPLLQEVSSNLIAQLRRKNIT